MPQIDRSKVCWDCQADVNDQATYCPFCGTDLLNHPNNSSPLFCPKEDQKSSYETFEKSLASFYKPPYSMRNQQGIGVPDEKILSSHPEEEPLKTEQPTLFKGVDKKLPEHTEDNLDQKGTVLPLLFLMIGTHLLILGILIFFCSREGKVILEWKSHLWFLYLIVGGPLFYIGIKLLGNQKF